MQNRTAGLRGYVQFAGLKVCSGLDSPRRWDSNEDLEEMRRKVQKSGRIALHGEGPVSANPPRQVQACYIQGRAGRAVWLRGGCGGLRKSGRAGLGGEGTR